MMLQTRIFIIIADYRLLSDRLRPVLLVLCGREESRPYLSGNRAFTNILYVIMMSLPILWIILIIILPIGIQIVFSAAVIRHLATLRLNRTMWGILRGREESRPYLSGNHTFTNDILACCADAKNRVPTIVAITLLRK